MKLVGDRSKQLCSIPGLSTGSYVSHVLFTPSAGVAEAMTPTEPEPVIYLG